MRSASFECIAPSCVGVGKRPFQVAAENAIAKEAISGPTSGEAKKIKMRQQLLKSKWPETAKSLRPRGQTLSYDSKSFESMIKMLVRNLSLDSSIETVQARLICSHIEEAQDCRDSTRLESNGCIKRAVRLN